MELDKRVDDYVAAIVRDVDLLLADTANLNAEQQHFAGELKQHAVRFLSLFNNSLPYFAELTHEAIVLVHDMRNPLGCIAGYCELLLTRETDNLNQSQLQLLQQIKAAHDFILNTFTTWVTAGQGTDNQLN